jgi:hypothetical protein
MRKLAYLVAAALVVSAPMLTTSTIDSFAAAKAKKKATSADESGGFFRAFSDQLSGQGDAGMGKQKKKAGKKKG